MLVVITIIGMIMALVGPRVLNYLSESRVKAAKIQIQSFSSALDLFYLDAGHFPTSSEGLPPSCAVSGVASWNGPYSRAERSQRPMGQSLCLQAAGGTRALRNRSLGSDGQEGGTGTSADLVSGAN